MMSEHAVLSAGCLATEAGLTIIDRACLFMRHFGAAEGAAARPYLKLLLHPQSETLYKHLFAALRAYINQYSETLFEGKYFTTSFLIYLRNEMGLLCCPFYRKIVCNLSKAVFCSFFFLKLQLV